MELELDYIIKAKRLDWEKYQFSFKFHLQSQNKTVFELIKVISKSWSRSCKGQTADNYEEFAGLVDQQTILEVMDESHRDYLKLVMDKITEEIDKQIKEKEAEFALLAQENDSDELKAERKSQIESLGRYSSAKSKILVEGLIDEFPKIISTKMVSRLTENRFRIPEGTEYDHFLFSLMVYGQKNHNGFKM